MLATYFNTLKCLVKTGTTRLINAVLAALDTASLMIAELFPR